MAVINTNADSLGIYLTGADSDGAAQADPSASLGGYRSSSEVVALGALVGQGVPALVVDQVAGANGTGQGTLRVDSGGLVYWTPPGGSEGAGVALANGASVLLEGGDTDKVVRVSRDGATMAAGSITLDLVRAMNNAIGMGDVDNATRVAGGNYYRCLMLKNHSSLKLSSIAVWFESGSTQATLSVAEETPSSDAVQTVADVNTAPTGVSWSTPTSEGTALSLSDLDADSMTGLWVRRAFSAADSVAPIERVEMRISFNVES